MCGIIGYVGARDTAPILLDGLRRLEYRGYDSAGVALQNGKGLQIRKVAGRVENLTAALEADPVQANAGIGHTRWATHGPPTLENAHPHVAGDDSLALVHNGIIENARAIREHLVRQGSTFATPTDTEVIVQLIHHSDGDTLEAKLLAALPLLEGTYGLAVMSSLEPGKIVVAKKGSPVLIGVGPDGDHFVASDPSAVLAHTRSVVYLQDGDVAVITHDGYEIYDHQGVGLDRAAHAIEWDLESIELGGYPHFMLKEIYEQPESVKNTMRGRLLEDEGTARLDGLNLSPETIAGIDRIVILACGTSWHSALIGREIIEELAGLPVQVEYASEFRYRTALPLEGALAVAISQSGETADTLEALRQARRSGARVVGVVNVVGSTIAREADGGIYLHAGPEIGVASTKAFTSQVVALLLLGLYLGRHRDLDVETGRSLVRELKALPEKLEQALELAEATKSLARLYKDAQNFLYLGRGVSFPVALEGALKLKEVSYIHAEGYPAAELKHGPLALIDEDMPAVFVAPEDHVYRKVLSSIQEVKARGGRTIVISTAGGESLEGLADYVLRIPGSPALLSPLLTVVPLQLLSYHIAVLRGCDVDRPRNLAKSVTVE